MNETLSKLIDLILAQSNDLWPLATGMIITAFLIMLPPTDKDGDRLPWFACLLLWLVIIASGVSLMFGWLVKGALIGQVDHLRAANPNWDLIQVETLSFLQLVFTAAAVGLFGAAFLFYRDFISRALSRVWGK